MRWPAGEQSLYAGVKSGHGPRVRWVVQQGQALFALVIAT